MEYLPYIWLGLAVVLGIVEIATSQLVSVWFVIGALVTAICSATFLKDLVLWQIVVFILVSAIALIFTRPLIKKLKKAKPENTNADRNIGKNGFVIDDIDAVNGTGMVKVGAEKWSAKSADGSPIEKNKSVKIIGIEGVKLIVTVNND